MKVLINISVITQKHRGMGTFAKQIIKELIANDKYDFIFVSGNDLDEVIFQIVSSSKHIFKQINTPLPIFEQIVIPYLIIKYKPDVCWFPSNTFPLIMNKNVKYITTVHDLIFLNDKIKPKTMYQKIGKYYRNYIILLGIKKVDNITSVSNTTLKEIYERFQIDRKIENNQVLYNSLYILKNHDNIIFQKLNMKSSDKYFYTIAGTAPHKNLDLLIESFKILKTKNPQNKLIVSGASKSKHNGIDKSIIFTPFISEEEKTSLIQNADLFIFPSLVEGFGIPLIEGLYHNPKVLVSDIDIFREIGREYVSYFDPCDKEFLIKYYLNPFKPINHEEAKKYILETFDARISTQKLESIFNEFK